jgi:DNA-binding response OmpR family regulator
MARVRAVLKRNSQQAQGDVLKFEGLEINIAGREVIVA